jgi:D-alanyl-D-alanine dipeptidase
VDPFSTLSRASLVLMIMTLPAPALAGSGLPKGFVYLRNIDPTIVQDIRYAGSHNFVGRPIRGYLAAECILSGSAANALETVQRMLTEKKLSLIVWDCYRPKRAVEDFFQWSKDPTHSEMKAEFYPRTDKKTCSLLGLSQNDRLTRGGQRWTWNSPDRFFIRAVAESPQLLRHARLQKARDSKMERSI